MIPTAPGPRREDFDRFSDAEFSRRHAAVRARMTEQGLDALVVYATSAVAANLRYLTNYAPYGTGTAYLLFPATGDSLLMTTIVTHVASARAIASVPVDWTGLDPAATIAAHLHDLGLARGRLGLVELDSGRNRGVPSVFADGLRQPLPAAALSWATTLVEAVRRIKSEEEIAVLERSAAMTERALDALIAAARPGARECDLAAAVAGAAARAGGTVEVGLIGSTPMANPAMSTPWTVQSNRTLERGDVILSELGIGVRGYSTQLLRPIAIGRPTAQYQELFDLAAEVYRSIQGALKPGATREDLRAAASALQRPGIAVEAPIAHGWSQWAEFGYHIAAPGQTALYWHGDRPVRFEANMSVVIEPNPCTADFSAGIFVGDMQIVRADGCQPLHRRPLEFILV